MSGRALLDVQSVTVRYGGVVALHDVSLQVAGGEIAGLIGPNGAGKTTFVDALSGFTTPTGGRIVLDGEDLTAMPPHDRARRGLSRTFQSLELFDDLSVHDNLRVAATNGTRRPTLRDRFASRPADLAHLDELLEVLELQGVAGRRPDELSNGERHRVALGRALAPRPRLVLLDEPAAGLDPTETGELARVLTRLPAMGTSVLLIDHDMALVLGVCDRVHVFDFGALVASGTPAEVRRDRRVVTAYLGVEEDPA